MEKPASSAAPLTGEFDISCPRPRGRSGCVTTASTLKSGCATRWRKVGSAKAGVPQKTILSDTTGLPLAGFFEFADFALDHVALEHAEVRDEENAVEVIDLVAESAGEQAFAAAFEFLAVGVEGANGDVLRP